MLWAWVERALCIWAWAWEPNNRLPAISKTTAYQIHDSILKATMARRPVVCGLARWGSSAYGRSLRYVHGYSCGDIAASWAAASFLALLAPRGIFSREPGRWVEMASAITQVVEARVRWRGM